MALGRASSDIRVGTGTGEVTNSAYPKFIGDYMCMTHVKLARCYSVTVTMINKHLEVVKQIECNAMLGFRLQQ